MDLRLSVWMFAAGHMVLRVFLGSHDTLVAVSVPFMMPLCDSDIPMNVPFTFSNKQPLPPAAGFHIPDSYLPLIPVFASRNVTLGGLWNRHVLKRINTDRGRCGFIQN